MNEKAKELLKEVLEFIYQKTEDYCILCGAKEYPVRGDMKGYDKSIIYAIILLIKLATSFFI